MGNQTSGYFIDYSLYRSAVEGPEYDYNPNYNQVNKAALNLTGNVIQMS